jgi:hypothetical protein
MYKLTPKFGMETVYFKRRISTKMSENELNINFISTRDTLHNDEKGDYLISRTVYSNNGWNWFYEYELEKEYNV